MDALSCVRSEEHSMLVFCVAFVLVHSACSHCPIVSFWVRSRSCARVQHSNRYPLLSRVATAPSGPALAQLLPSAFARQYGRDKLQSLFNPRGYITCRTRSPLHVQLPDARSRQPRTRLRSGLKCLKLREPLFAAPPRAGPLAGSHHPCPCRADAILCALRARLNTYVLRFMRVSGPHAGGGGGR